jgi:protein SCO1
MRIHSKLIAKTREMDLSKRWRLLIRRAPERFRTSTWVCFIFFATPLLLGACNRASHQSGVYPVDYHATTLPNVTLTDQFGEYVPLASLKGKAALFDFIYTSCPGPCQLLTQHMKLIADRLGPDLGPRVSFVSVTVDPEHDRPSRLLDYARALDANVKGWYFLTGSPSQIDALMRAFQLGRSRDTGGEIDHVLGYFLVSPDGRETVDYSQHVDPVIAARDVEEATSSNTLFGRWRANFRRL